MVLGSFHNLTFPSPSQLILLDASCPRVAKEEESLNELPEVKKIIDESQDLFKFLTEKTGGRLDNITMASFLYDTLEIEVRFHLFYLFIYL